MPGQANQMFSQSMGMPNMAGYQQLNMQQQGKGVIKDVCLVGYEDIDCCN